MGVPRHPKNIAKTSLVCGAHHKKMWGSTGYDKGPAHWCNKAKKECVEDEEASEDGDGDDEDSEDGDGDSDDGADDGDSDDDVDDVKKPKMAPGLKVGIVKKK